MKKLSGVVALAALLTVWLLPAREAQAVAQWSRKYKVNCQTCHTAFPRLNYFGEKFQRNGFQMSETEDGDENKEKLSDHVFVDNLINMFGVRVAVTPANVVTNGLTRPNGSNTTSTSFGNTNWVQFFSAGTIFKNTSIFIETEVEDTAIHNNWFTLGYHNLFGQSLLNLRVGKLGVMNWHAMNGRLRMIPNINLEGWSNVRTSEGTRTTGTGAITLRDQVAVANPQPGIELYGYNGPFLYSVGVVNGSALTDRNEFKNVFGTLRLEVPEGELQGSSVSGWGYWGTDTGDVGTTRNDNRYYRISGAANARYKKWDVLAGYIFNRDKDWDMFTAGNQQNTIHSIATQVGYMINPKWFAAGQYDWVKDNDNSGASSQSTNDYQKVSPSIWYMPRENMRIGLVNRYELRSRGVIGRQHEFIVHVRAMF